jgi:hypothetical protein
MENTKNKFEGLYIIGYGLSGGFGGIRNYEVVEANSESEAEMMAWEAACDEYESYVGMYGLRTVEEIMEEDDIEDDEEAYETFNDERESWLDYNSQPYSKEYENEVKDNHYHNGYTDITG